MSVLNPKAARCVKELPDAVSSSRVRQCGHPDQWQRDPGCELRPARFKCGERASLGPGAKPAFLHPVLLVCPSAPSPPTKHCPRLRQFSSSLSTPMPLPIVCPYRFYPAIRSGFFNAVSVGNECRVCLKENRPNARPGLCFVWLCSLATRYFSTSVTRVPCCQMSYRKNLSFPPDALDLRGCALFQFLLTPMHTPCRRPASLQLSTPYSRV